MTLDASYNRQLEAEERTGGTFRSLFESTPGLFLVVEPEHYKIIAVSDAYLKATMTERETILGRKLFEVFPDDPKDPSPTGVRNLSLSLERVKKSRQADAMAVQRYPVRRPDGVFEERWWSPINAPVFGSGGELCYIIHRVEDVTSYVRTRENDANPPYLRDDRTQLLEAEIVLRAQDLQRSNDALRKKEEELKAANQDLSDFATIVSHDLKAPLRGVATLAKWLQSDYGHKLDPEGRENLSEMVKRVARMDRMIDGILQYSRIGRVKENIALVQTSELVAELAEDLSPKEHVRIELAAGLPRINGDSVQLRQVFQNLLSNAIKFADKPEAKVRVGWRDTGEFWQFEVSDNGPGIEPRHFERIFKLFETLAPKDKTDSTGVGLALVKRIVENAGGKVRVESVPGAGSNFYFTWPKRRFAKSEESAEAGHEQSARQMNPAANA